MLIQGRGYAASDMFSIGVLIHAIYNNGVSLLDCHERYGVYLEAVKKVCLFVFYYHFSIHFSYANYSILNYTGIHVLAPILGSVIASP